MSIHPCIECDNEVSPCQQALQCDDYGRSYGLSDFLVVSLHGFVRNQEKVSQAYEMSVSKKRVHTKRTTLHFFVRNGERFPLLLETNNALNLHSVIGNKERFSDKNFSTLLPINSLKLRSFWYLFLRAT